MDEFGEIKKIKWYATTTEGAKTLSTAEIKSSDVRLLFYLLSKIDENNRVKLNKYKQIEEEVFLSVPTIKKSMMNLKKEKIIVKDVNHLQTIFINPRFFYAGNYKSIDKKQDYFNNCFDTINKPKEKELPL